MKSESDFDVTLSSLLEGVSIVSNQAKPITPRKVEQLGSPALSHPPREISPEPAPAQEKPNDSHIMPEDPLIRPATLPDHTKNDAACDGPGLSKIVEDEYKTHSPEDDTDVKVQLEELEGFLYQKQLNNEVLKRTGSNWTSLAKIYAEAKASGQPPKLPEEGPPCWKCEKASTLQRAKNTNPNGNVGRSFYVCIRCPFAGKDEYSQDRNTFIVFADLIGVGADLLCYCGERTREGRTGRRARCGPGKKFWTCAEGRCGFIEWEHPLR